MESNSFKRAENIFHQNNGLLRTGQAKKLGIDEVTLIQMCEKGLLTREAFGLYRLADLPPLTKPGMVVIALRVPQAIFCLISALNFYDLTTQIPYEVYIGLPKDVKKPRMEYPPLNVTYLSEPAYSSGIEQHIIDEVPVRIYSREKTVADCFKFRNKIGQDVATEALKDYLRQPGRDIPRLLEFARIDRVEKVIMPYLKAAL